MNAPILELVHGCNLACAHCMVSPGKDLRFLAVEDVATVVEKLHLAGFAMAGLTGSGEVTLHPGLGKVLEILVRRGMGFDLLTNGTRFREVLLPLLNDRAIRRRAIRIGFSLDGPTAAIHDNNREPGSFARVLEGIALCRALEIPVYLKTALRRENLPVLRELVLFAANLGVEQIRFISSFPTPRSVADNSVPAPFELRGAKSLIENWDRLSNGRIFWEGWMGDRLPPLGECNASRNFAVDSCGNHLLCAVLADVDQGDAVPGPGLECVGNLLTMTLEETIRRHFTRLAEVLKWRVQARQVMAPWDFPMCYWCFYQMGKLEWLKRYPDSPWAAGVLRAVARGIAPLS